MASRWEVYKQMLDVDCPVATTDKFVAAQRVRLERLLQSPIFSADTTWNIEMPTEKSIRLEHAGTYYPEKHRIDIHCTTGDIQRNDTTIGYAAKVMPPKVFELLAPEHRHRTVIFTLETAIAGFLAPSDGLRSSLDVSWRIEGSLLSYYARLKGIKKLSEDGDMLEMSVTQLDRFDSLGYVMASMWRDELGFHPGPGTGPLKGRVGQWDRTHMGEIGTRLSTIFPFDPAGSVLSDATYCCYWSAQRAILGAPSLPDILIAGC